MEMGRLGLLMGRGCIELRYVQVKLALRCLMGKGEPLF